VGGGKSLLDNEVDGMGSEKFWVFDFKEKAFVEKRKVYCKSFSVWNREEEDILKGSRLILGGAG